MEAVSLAAGVLPIFKLCLESFQLYKTAQATSIESRILLYQLDCEHERFNIWGEVHGVFLEKGDSARHQALDQPETESKLTKGLELINQLLSDAKDLQERYGVAVSTTTQAEHVPQEPYPSTSGLRRLKWLKKHKEGDSQSLGMVKKTLWAINDRSKFHDLVTALRGLVARLYETIPVPPRHFNAIAIRDIRSLGSDPARLDLFEAASEREYPAWSGAASLMREAASTRGAPDAVSEWLGGIETTVDLEDELQSGAVDVARTPSGIRRCAYPLVYLQAYGL